MKKFALGVIALGVLSMTSCKKDDGATTTPTNPTTTVLPNGSVLPSNIETGKTVTLGEGFNYTLSSSVRVKNGGTITIKPGVTVTAQNGQPTSMFLLVEQGGKIMAQGTDAKPIVFTAKDKKRGAWGGIVVAGKAPINLGTTATGEVADVVYGGTDAADNSGIISYVRTEYTGSQISSTKQHNGFSFYGVGNGTKIDHIQAYMGADDGIEFFGGTVNVSYAVSMASLDDNFDWAEGYVGKVNYLYLEQSADKTLEQDKGIEGDNLKKNNGAAPVSNPTISNVTIIGKPGIKNGDGEKTDGMRLREGTKGTFTNVVIKGYDDEGIDIRSIATIKNVLDGSLSFSKLYIGTVGDKKVDAKIDSGEADPNGDAKKAKDKVTNGLETTEGKGADFNTWKGNWVKSL